MMIKRLILALMLVFSFSGVAMADSDFYKSAIQMGTSYCPDTSFDCSNLAQSRTEIIAAANECAASRLDITEKVMSNFSTSGEFENCVLSDRSVKDRRGVNNWAICCVKKNGDTCEMTCTRYIDQK
jgi:hypothetical protein